MARRELIKTVMVGLGTLALGPRDPTQGGNEVTQEHTAATTPAFRHRLGFGAWINDMRNQALPLEQWPAPQMDELTVEGITRTLEVMSEAGYQYLDTFGLYATRDYPPDIVSAFEDQERNRRLEEIYSTAERLGIKLSLPLGLMTWGYDRILREDPAVRGKNADGSPHPHAMCGAQEKSWAYIEKLIDTMFSRHRFGAVHLESADLGYCMCDRCTGQYGVVGYNCLLNMRAADIIKSRCPDVLVYVCPINWMPWALNEEGVMNRFAGDDLQSVIELSKHIDVFMDQGHRGRFLDYKDVPSLHCDYGTSGGLWVYHGARLDRLSYFLPHVRRTAQHLREQYQGGTRACLVYQGPMINPAVQMNSACTGRLLVDPFRDPMDVATEVISVYYQPRTDEAARRLAQVYLDVEEAYFGQWSAQRFREAQNMEMPGEFMVGVLFNTSPDAVCHFSEPFLDAAGRAACRIGLRTGLAQAIALRDQFGNLELMDRVIRALALTIQSLATVMMARGESWMD